MRQRILALAAVIVTVLAGNAVLSWRMLHILKLDQDVRLERLRRDQEREIIADVKGRVETVHLLLQYWARYHTNQVLARQEALAVVSNIRFGDGNYVWIHRLDTNNLHAAFMLAHPATALQGKNHEGLIDWDWFTNVYLDGEIVPKTDPRASSIKPRELFLAFNQVALEKGEGLVEYYWPKTVNGQLTPVAYRKLACVKYFAPWHWVIAAGAYADHIDLALQARAEKIQRDQRALVIKVMLLIILYSVGIVVVVAWLGWRLVRRQVAELKAEVAERARAVHLLHQNRARMAGINQNLPGVLFQFYAKPNGDMGLYYADGRIDELFGLDKEPLDSLFTRFMAQVAPGSRAAILGAIQQAIQTRTAFAFEGQYYKPDGTELWFSATSQPRDMDGELVFDGLILDITDRKRAEEALAKRMVALTQPLETRGGVAFEDLFDLAAIQRIQDEFAAATGVASIITHTDGTPITAPSRFCRLCNDIIRQTEQGRLNCYQSDAVLGRHNPAGPIVQPCLSGGLWDAGASIHVGGRHVANWLIGQVRDDTQTEEHMRQYAQAIGADEQDFLRAFREVPAMSKAQFERIAQLLFSLANQLSSMAYQNVQQARFIADRQRADLARQEIEERFRSLFENMTEGVALHQVIYENGQPVNYQLLDVNPAYETHTGLKREKAIGALGHVVYGTEQPPYLKEFTEVAASGIPYVYETYFPPLNKHFHISVISPRRGYFATVFEDITARKTQQEELRRKNEELERFTYTVSHDLKSPLITIKGFAGAMQQDLQAGNPERLAGDLQRIADAADKMSALLNDLLNLSRIGRMVNPPAPVPLAQVAEETLALLAGGIAAISAEVVVQPDLPVVLGDRQRLQEVLQNLMENALKFLRGCPQPRIEIGVRRDGPQPVIWVRDNGIGIDPAYHETIFGLFNKLDPRSEGTGIGLALVRRIIEYHHGRVWVESAGKGQGATFCFTLPSAPAQGTVLVRDK